MFATSADIQRRRVQAAEATVEGKITKAALVSVGVSQALATASAARSEEQLKVLQSYFRQSSLYFATELTEVQQLDCCRCFTPVDVARYETVFEQGARSDQFYLIAAGSVAVLISGRCAAAAAAATSKDTFCAFEDLRVPVRQHTNR